MFLAKNLPAGVAFLFVICCSYFLFVLVCWGALYFDNTDKTRFNLIVIFILDNRSCFFFYYFCRLIRSQTIGWIVLALDIRKTKSSCKLIWNSCQVILTLLSDRMVMAFVLAISRIKARQYIIHRLVFIPVDMWLEIRSATSTPPLVWS